MVNDILKFIQDNAILIGAVASLTVIVGIAWRFIMNLIFFLIIVAESVIEGTRKLIKHIKARRATKKRTEPNADNDAVS